MLPHHIAQLPDLKVPKLDLQRLAEFERLLAEKTKPVGSLGRIEEIAKTLCLVQNTTWPTITRPTIVVFAGDHGIADEGVSAYPQSVTARMVTNFLNGGAAINVLVRENQAELWVVDSGVKSDLPEHPRLIQAKVGHGTQNFRHGRAMTDAELTTAIKRGQGIVDSVFNQGTNTIGFGEMGIGNSSSAAAMISRVCHLPIEKCVGSGTGLGAEALGHKIATLEAAIARVPDITHPLAVMAYFGGFELAMMCGAMLRAAQLGMTQLVDGFCATAALVVAHALEPNVLDYCLFSHLSAEPGHVHALKYLKAEALLHLGMRLGEGTGCAMALPLVRMAAALVRDMATFEGAGIAAAIEGQV